MKKTLIQSKILKLIIPFISVTLIVMMFISYQQSYNSQKTLFEFCMHELSSKSCNEVTTKLEVMKDELKWVADDPAFNAMDETIFSKRLDELALEENDYFSMIFVAWPDGRYYISGRGFAQTNIADRKYHKDIFQGGKPFSMTSPDASKSTGEKKYTLAVPIKNENGATVGLIAGNVKLNTLKKVVEDCKFGKNGITYIVDENARLIGTLYDELLLNFNLITDGAKVYPGLEEIGKAVTQGKAANAYCKDIQNGGYLYTMSHKIEGTPGWFMVGCLPDTEFRSAANNNLFVMAVFCLIIIIAIIIIVPAIMKRTLTNPLQQLSTAIKGVSEGELNQKLDYTSNDEIGGMTDDLRTMCGRLSDIANTLKEGAETLAMSSSMVKESSKQLSDGTSAQASAIEELSATMEEMSSNIEQNTHNAEMTKKVSEEASSKFSEVVTNIDNVVKTNREISEKISIINDVAYQTNILALNAAVEAARAGEYGKGFAVVASEVRKLAENSKRAADAIVEVTRLGLNNSATANKAMQEALPKVQNTSTLVNEIATASVEQNTGAIQINEVIQRLNGVVQVNAESASILSQSADELSVQADNLRNITEFFKN